jgi:SAM-dependent methyltransferase
MAAIVAARMGPLPGGYIRTVDLPDEAAVAAAESIRLQAEEHPVIDDAPAASPSDHCLRLMHLKAYEEAASLAAGRDVLDVGCNSGYGTLRFVPVARRVVGVDVSPRAIEAAQASAVDGRPEFLAIDGLALPFPDASFDLVTSFQVVEHIADPVPYLQEIVRVARPGAIVLLTTPNAATRLDPGMTPWNRFHVREFLAPELDTLLRSVFPKVLVRGMFGTPTLYQTEIERVDAARRRTRRLEEAARTVGDRPAPARRRPLPVRLARAVVPPPARSWLRSAVGRGARPAQTVTAPARSATAVPATAVPAAGTMDLEAYLRFSTADLFYADHDLERAMDLMAVCRVE